MDDRLTPWSVPRMTVPLPAALKQQVKRKRRMNRTIRRKAGSSCGIIPEALFIITPRRPASHPPLLRFYSHRVASNKIGFLGGQKADRGDGVCLFSILEVGADLPAGQTPDIYFSLIPG